MSSATAVVASRERTPIVPSAVLAVAVIIIVEAMFFSGLVSAFLITRAGVAPGTWPPPTQPRLPVGSTALNTAALLASGLAALFCARKHRRDPASAQAPLYVAIALGALFVLLQGSEWVALLGEGLRLSTSTHGAFFYLIVGSHGLHVVAGLVALVWAALQLGRGSLSADAFKAVRAFWYFVVLLWPLLYYEVYLT